MHLGSNKWFIIIIIIIIDTQRLGYAIPTCLGSTKYINYYRIIIMIQLPNKEFIPVTQIIH
jgi:hypothetical protein